MLQEFLEEAWEEVIVNSNVDCCLDAAVITSYLRGAELVPFIATALSQKRRRFTVTFEPILEHEDEGKHVIASEFREPAALRRRKEETARPLAKAQSRSPPEALVSSKQEKGPRHRRTASCRSLCTVLLAQGPEPAY